jgi:hypothetical protein
LKIIIWVGLPFLDFILFKKILFGGRAFISYRESHKQCISSQQAQKHCLSTFFPQKSCTLAGFEPGIRAYYLLWK